MDGREELIKKVTAYVSSAFFSDFRRAFNWFDGDGDGLIDAVELTRLLSAAGIGNALTRSIWVRGVIAEMDTDHDQRISWDEFQDAIKAK